MLVIKIRADSNHIQLVFAKDCLLTLVKGRLALGSPGCSFVCLSPCQKWPNTQDNGCWLPPSDHIQSETHFQTRQDQENGMNGPASLLHSWRWVLLFHMISQWAHHSSLSWHFSILKVSGRLCIGDWRLLHLLAVNMEPRVFGELMEVKTSFKILLRIFLWTLILFTDFNCWHKHWKISGHLTLVIASNFFSGARWPADGRTTRSSWTR